MLRPRGAAAWAQRRRAGARVLRAARQSAQGPGAPQVRGAEGPRRVSRESLGGRKRAARALASAGALGGRARREAGNRPGLPSAARVSRGAGAGSRARAYARTGDESRWGVAWGRRGLSLIRAGGPPPGRRRHGAARAAPPAPCAPPSPIADSPRAQERPQPIPIAAGCTALRGGSGPPFTSPRRSGRSRRHRLGARRGVQGRERVSKLVVARGTTSRQAAASCWRPPNRATTLTSSTLRQSSAGATLQEHYRYSQAPPP